MLLPHFSACIISQDKDSSQELKPEPHQILVHNLEIDKVEVHDKKDLLSSYPYEVPCQSLLSALLNYQSSIDLIRELFGMVNSFDLCSYQLVHLKNLSDRKGEI